MIGIGSDGVLWGATKFTIGKGGVMPHEEDGKPMFFAKGSFHGIPQIGYV